MKPTQLSDMQASTESITRLVSRLTLTDNADQIARLRSIISLANQLANDAAIEAGAACERMNFKGN